MITSYDELPPHFKELYKSLPPRLDIPRACEVSQSSRAILYEKFGSGRVIAVKDGGKTLADTLSLLLDLVNWSGYSGSHVKQTKMPGQETAT